MTSEDLTPHVFGEGEKVAEEFSDMSESDCAPALRTPFSISGVDDLSKAQMEGGEKEKASEELPVGSVPIVKGVYCDEGQLAVATDCNGPFNREILENLCAVSPASYLANFRYVCKEWNEAALKSWRHETQLAVVDYRSEPRKSTFKKFINLPDLINYIEDPADPLKLDPAKEYQFRKYKLQNWYLTDKNQNITKFWGHFGQSIKHLELSCLRIPNLATILGILYGQVPNLETLILEKIAVDKKSVLDDKGKEDLAAIPPQEKLKVLRVRNLVSFPVNWTDFFQHFPRIEVFESFNVKSDTDLMAILTAMGTIRNDNDWSMLPVTSLTIRRGDGNSRFVSQPLTPLLLRNLDDCDFPVEELHLKFGHRAVVRSADTVLAMFANDNLKKLTFHVDYKSNPISVNRFPYHLKFPNLEELELFQWCTPETHLHILLGAMPNLKVLKVKGIRNLFSGVHGQYQYIVSGLSKKDLNICKSLEEFSFTKFKLEKISIQYLAKLAPNLTRLEVKLEDDDMFREICMEFPKLIEFRVSGKGLTDKGITGMLGYDESLEVVRSDTLYSNLNIHYLKNLRVFVMHDRNHELTSQSVFDGFLKVESLFTLDMSLPQGQISQEARQTLEEKIPNLIIRKEMISQSDLEPLEIWSEEYPEA